MARPPKSTGRPSAKALVLPENEPAEAPAAPALSFVVGEIDRIPLDPGVYIMRDAAGKILYIGKSISLRQRVRQYFAEKGDSRPNARVMARKVAAVEIITTRSDKEALVLEINLIQRHRPPYNLRLMDDKSFFSLQLDLSKRFPRLEFVRTRAASRKPVASHVEMFGPFPSGYAAKRTIRELLKFFPLRSCADSTLNNRTRPCILHEIGKCCAPCVLDVPKEEYDELIDGTRQFLRGKRDEVIETLEKRMMERSEALEFEKAADIRDRLAAIRESLQTQAVAGADLPDRDAVAMVRKAGRIVFVVLRYRSGTLAETERFDEIDMDEPDPEVMRQFLAQYYGSGLRKPPEQLLLSHAPADVRAVQSLLRHYQPPTAKRRLRLGAPTRGALREPVDLALRMAEQAMELHLAGEKSREEVMAVLERKLELPAPPRRIDCFDISAFQGGEAVGVAIRFKDSEPDKANYRKFNIRGAADDFAAMRETLSRRYRRLIEEAGEMPDLILIDGGKGQLAQAVDVTRELGLHDIPLAAIAKSRPQDLPPDAPSDVAVRSEERIFLPGRKDAIFFRRDQQQALYLLQRVRDETHRFAVETHRTRRRKATLTTSLIEIPGVGEKRAKTLLRAMGSLSAVKAASVEELVEKGGVPRKVAERIAERFAEARAVEPIIAPGDDEPDLSLLEEESAAESPNESEEVSE
jgi:excinuclease ABC subunit C